MGNMSASDPAPLPRLGEVFFDVRGSARSMRLSWYADTGVAVFSIWQAGTCTGTFRLPMGELQRMIETLRHGPGGGPAAVQGGSHTGRYLPASSDIPGPRAGARWDDQDGVPLGYQDSQAPGRYPPGPGPLGYQGGSQVPASYPPGPGPLDYDCEGGLAAGPLDYPGERTQAHYLPAPAGSGYDLESEGRAAVSWADNGEAVSGRDARGRPPESFPYGSPAAPQR